MKVRKIFIQTIAMLMCVVTLSLSVGGKFCFYDNISKTYAADPFTITMGSLALEEIIMGIAIAVLGAEVAYQYRDEILDAYKEFSKNGNNLYAGQNLFEVYSNGEHSVRTWDEYEEILKGMGVTASEAFDDYKEKFNNVYIKPSKEYLQYVADFYTDLFTGSPAVGDATYIDGLTELLQQVYIYPDDVQSIISTSEPYNYQGHFLIQGKYIHPYYADQSYYQMLQYDFDFTSNDRISCYVTLKNDSNNDLLYSVGFYGIGTNKNLGYYDISMNYTELRDGKVNHQKTDKISSFHKYQDSQFTNMMVSNVCNIPIFGSSDDAFNFAKTGQGIENAINYTKSMDSIAVTGDDIPTVGNWEELWERLKNPDLPWWFLNPDALPGTNAVDLPWFDVAGLHDWANDIPNTRDGIIDSNPDIPWSDVWDKVIDIPDVIIPEIDFPYPGVQDPSIPKVDDPTKPGVYDPSTDKPIDLTEEMEGIADYVPTLADSFTDLGNGLKTKFPFSIPWDIHYILSGLATTPKAPRFELPLKVERYGIDETIVVDMARFQVLSDLSRSIFSLLFALALINLTIKVIGSFKEE